MKLRAVLLLAALASTVLVVLGASPSAAAVCSVAQITHTTGVSVQLPHLSDDGTRIAFLSSGEFGDFGDNGDANVEAWLYDVGTGPAATIQLTNTTSGSVDRLDMDGDGDRFAIESSGDPVGDNADGSSEIFLVDTTAATTTQVTDSTGDSNGPAIDGAGARLAFRSNGDLISGGNGDGNREVFVYDVGTDDLTQLTTTTDGSNRVPTLSRDGNVVAFGSTSPELGDNDDGSDEIYLRNLSPSTLTQITDDTTEDSSGPVLNGAGTLVAFSSSADIGGGNPDGNDEAFLHRTANSTTTQLTSTADEFQSNPEELNAAGNRLVLVSDQDPTGSNPNHVTQVVLRDGQGHQGLSSITDDPAEQAVSPALNADGTRLAYVSGGDPIGDNPDGGDEVFLATCGAVLPTYTDVPAGNFFYDAIQWMAEAEVANGFPNGTFKPGDPVKRQQMANFLYNLAGRPAYTPPVTPTFNDVPASNPFYVQIEWMNAEGIANGFPGGLFKPGDPVKRQQMANFLYNLAGQPAFTPPGSPTFADVPPANAFFLQVEWMAAEGIANGFPGGIYKPNDPVKRQQMAQFLLNLVNGPGVDLD